MRVLASRIKEHALAHLDSYLEQFEAAAKANGVVVHWAADAAEHNRIVHGILKERGAKTLIKSKSMLTDECRITGEQPQENRQVLESRNDLLDALVGAYDNRSRFGDRKVATRHAGVRSQDERSGGLPAGRSQDAGCHRHSDQTPESGSCTNVCPVKINIHEQIFAWRKVMSEEHRLPFVKSEMMKVLGYVLARPALYRAALRTADEALRLLPHFVLSNPLNTWTSKGRAMPVAPRQTFHAWWQEHRVQGRDSP
jgi:L-lactate utilization protein LutB